MRIAAVVLVAGGLLAAQPRSPFDAIVAAYRAGRVDGAMGLLEDLGPNRFPANVDAMTSTPADPWYAATVALVVAEAGMKAGTLGGQDSRAPVYTLEPGSKLVWDLVPKLEDYAERSHQTSVVDFCRTWWLWVSSWRLRTSRALAVPKDSDVRFRNAPDLLVNEAAAHESLMGPILRGGFGSPIPASMLEYASGAPAPAGTFIESVHGRFWAQSARDAEVALKHAIALKPNLAEAHLRLGRVLYQQGRHKDAQAEFVRAQALSAAANDPWTSAISGMLLGRLFEGNRQMDKAAEAYRQAVALQIPGQSPALALGTFLIRQGTEEEGWKTIQQAFATSAQNLDPWVAYPAGAFHRNAELLETLRNYVQIGPNSTTGVASFGAASKSTRPASEGTPANAGALPVPTHGSSGIHIDGVRLDIRVIGTDGPVKGLTAADFEIRDNGVLQKADLQQVSPGLNLVLVSDRSASMKQAIATITDAASLLTSSLQQGDVVSAVRFSDRIDLVALQQSFRTPLPALAPATVSRSVLRDAIAAGASLLTGAPGSAWIVALTDGGDNASWVERSELVEALMHSSVVLDCVLAQPDWVESDIAYGDVAVEGLTKPTGGLVFDASGKDLGERLLRRIEEIRSSYVLTFIPTGVKQGDGYHKLNVKLKGGSDVGTIQTRAGYYSTGRPGR